VVTYNEHLKKILSQTLDSYNALKEIQDKPGDLDHIKKEMLKINGFLKVATNNIDEYKITLSDFKKLKSKFEHYLENYFFEKEIETMAPLYSDDIHRVKNMRLKIIEALEDKKMMESIGDLIEKL
jgi:polyphosphate kinase